MSTESTVDSVKIGLEIPQELQKQMKLHKNNFLTSHIGLDIPPMSSCLETIMLGKSDLVVPRLGFGCWQLGGNGWQGIDQRSIISAIHQALAQGFNFFDTSDIYGIGTSESLLGETLASSSHGQSAIIATKFGVRIENGKKWYDNSAQWMREALHASLRRLKRDRIDLYLMHWHDEKRPIDDIFSDLEALRESGKIRWYGVCNLPFKSLPETLPPGCVSYSIEYNLVRRNLPDEHRVAIARDRLSLIGWGGLAQGLLAGEYNRHSTFDKTDIRSRNTHIFVDRYWPAYDALLGVLKQAADAHGRTMSQTALRWVLDSQPGSVTLAGVQKGEQFSENVGALGWHLEPHWLQQLNAASLTCHNTISAL